MHQAKKTNPLVKSEWRTLYSRRQVPFCLHQGILALTLTITTSLALIRFIDLLSTSAYVTAAVAFVLLSRHHLLNARFFITLRDLYISEPVLGRSNWSGTLLTYGSQQRYALAVRRQHRSNSFRLRTTTAHHRYSFDRPQSFLPKLRRTAYFSIHSSECYSIYRIPAVPCGTTATVRKSTTGAMRRLSPGDVGKRPCPYHTIARAWQFHGRLG